MWDSFPRRIARSQVSMTSRHSATPQVVRSRNASPVLWRPGLPFLKCSTLQREAVCAQSGYPGRPRPHRCSIDPGLQRPKIDLNIREWVPARGLSRATFALPELLVSCAAAADLPPVGHLGARHQFFQPCPGRQDCPFRHLAPHRISNGRCPTHEGAHGLQRVYPTRSRDRSLFPQQPPTRETSALAREPVRSPELRQSAVLHSSPQPGRCRPRPPPENLFLPS